MSLHPASPDVLPQAVPPQLLAGAALRKVTPEPAQEGERLITLRSPAVLPFPCYDSLDLELDAASGTCWCFMRPEGRASFTPQLMADIARMQAAVRHMGKVGLDAGGTKLRYFVMASRRPGVFNLGGDLALFARAIRARDRAALRQYGHGAVRALHENTRGYDAGAITIALVQGDALGGGFECALAFDLIVAERRARLGFPEILFNLFPGMGAYSYLSRRIAPAEAGRMISSGQIHTAEELHAMGVIDVLVEDGQGEQAVRELIARQGRRQNAFQAISHVRRRVNPVSLQELLDVVDIWVDAALNLEEADLRRMQRLVAAQDRRCAEAAPLAHA
ncbi:Crotonase/enoyl-CoA hydratase family protein [Rhodovastum atsumiense]|nr:crotonase/enoyl-CoA hydratase family protein [Rhodovastum atsumiense]CAH2599382.1 Crotonase/enoyl-CoA hydratase family protein [Rhodovastum atsumiense]